MKRKGLFLLAGCLCAMTLCVCLSAATANVLTAAAAEAETETELETEAKPTAAELAEMGLKEFAIEEVGTFYLPEDFEVESGFDDANLPMHYATFTKGDVTIHVTRFGTDAYEAAGLPLPEDLEDYSTRAGVRQGLPEDAEFDTDEYGNMYVQFADEEGTMQYLVLKAGKEAYGAMTAFYPEDTEEDIEDIPFWISLSELE